MAAPHVAGAAALLLGAHPTATPAQVWTNLRSTSTSTPTVLGDIRAGSPNRLLFVAPTSTTFIDISTSYVFVEHVEWMAAEGISTGYQPGPEYRPSAAVSRQAMSAFMYRLAGSPPFVEPGTPTFGDVGPANPFSTEIEWMADAGIATGTPASPKPLYKPSQPVSRGAMAAFMHRLAGEPAFTPPAAGATTFGDVSAGYAFYLQVEWLAAEQISTGTAASPKPLYKPADPVSRGAMSAFMHRLADGPGVGL
jgi:hypothetical protein